MLMAVLSNTYHAQPVGHSSERQEGFGHFPVLATALPPAPHLSKAPKSNAFHDTVTRVAKLKTRSLEDVFISLFPSGH